MELMAEWPTMTRTEHGALVHTHCMMPSGATVNVFVQPAIDGFLVSDNGAVLGEISGTGVSDEHVDRHVSRIAKQRGLRFHEGSIFSPKVSASEVPLAVILVANVAKDAADYVIETCHREIDERPIHEVVSSFAGDRNHTIEGPIRWK